MNTDVTADSFVAPTAYDSAAPWDPVSTADRLTVEPHLHWLRETLWTMGAVHPRSLQRDIGPSELGLACSRQIAYRIAGTAPSNISVNPLPSMVGTSVHATLADHFRSQPPGRYLVEHRVSYRGIAGTLDLYDRRTGIAWDWKCSRVKKIRSVQRDGPPRHYRWQLQTYGQGLIAQGESPRLLMVGYVPIDGDLDDIACWSYPVSRGEADEAIDRLTTIRTALDDAAGQPGQVPAHPSRLCPWCPYNRPQWTGDLNVACPGEVKP